MRSFAFAIVASITLASPVVAADLDREPCCAERGGYVERERIVERRYYIPPPVVEEVVVAPRYYAPRYYAGPVFYSRPYYRDWRPRYAYGYRSGHHFGHHYGRRW